jgi:Fe2+ transport system protein B
VVLNLIDEAMDRGIAVDADVLSRRLGVPVISTVATTGDGVPALKKVIPLAGRSVAVPVLSSEIQRSLQALEIPFKTRAVAPWPSRFWRGTTRR